MNSEENFYKDKQRAEKAIDKLIEKKVNFDSFIGRWRILSILKRARKKVKYDDYVYLRNKVAEAIENNRM